MKMKKKPGKRKATGGLRREYDFSKLKGAVRGKHTALYKAGKRRCSGLEPD
jgi:hypothetical protein